MIGSPLILLYFNVGWSIRRLCLAASQAANYDALNQLIMLLIFMLFDF